MVRCPTIKGMDCSKHYDRTTLVKNLGDDFNNHSGPADP